MEKFSWRTFTPRLFAEESLRLSRASVDVRGCWGLCACKQHVLKCLCGGCEVWCCWPAPPALSVTLAASQKPVQLLRAPGRAGGVPLPPPLPSHKSLNSVFSHDSIGHVWRCCSWLFWWILGVLTALWHELQHNKHMAIAWPVQLLFTSVSCRRKKITYWRCVITRKGAYGSFLILFFPQHEFPGAGNNSNSCSHFFCTVCFIHAVVFHCIQVKLLVWNELG